MTKNPVIWKKEDCLVGECKDLHSKHWWSFPFTTPAGLMCECYHCGKTKFIKIEESNMDIPKQLNNEEKP